MESNQNQPEVQVTDQERMKLEQQNINTIYVSDLPRGCSYMDIDSVFGSYGKQEIIMKRTPEHFYYAFVIFEDRANGKSNTSF
jgi:hypothetical protein